MMVVVVVMMIVVIVIGRPLQGTGAAGLGTLDGRRTHEGIGAEHQAAADGLTRFRVFRQWGILNRLPQLETPHFFARPREGFIDVGDHSAGKELCPKTADPAHARQIPISNRTRSSHDGVCLLLVTTSMNRKRVTSAADPIEPGCSLIG